MSSRDPDQAAFRADYSQLDRPVSIRLTAESRAALQVVIDELRRHYRTSIVFTQVREGRRRDWLAYGTLLVDSQR